MARVHATILVLAMATPIGVHAQDGGIDAGVDGGVDAAVDGGADAGVDGGDAGSAQTRPPNWYLDVHGELEGRFNAMSWLPLRELPGEPGTGELGQNGWMETWVRMRAEGGYRPAKLKAIATADFLSGVLAGDHAIGVYPSRWRRDRFVGLGATGGCTDELSCQRESPGVTLRQAYLEWETDVGVLRVGQQAFHAGMGLVANDGDHRPIFGDYRYGDLVERVLFAVQPLGRTTPFFVAAAGDLVFDDGLADLRRGDVAWQAVLAAFYQEGNRSAGGFVAYRDQRSPAGDFLRAAIFDLNFRWDSPEPTGGRVFAAAEGAIVIGDESLTHTIARPSDRVRQGLFAVQLGRTSDAVDATLEGGWSSGDANTEDGVQTRATMDGDHRVGLILFPEVLNWMSARAVAYGVSPWLVGRPAPGSELVPTDGGVAGALYLFPYLVLHITPWLEAHVGGVVARTSVDNVDPVQQRLTSRSVNWRGGSALARDLGLELDASIVATTEVRPGLKFVGGIEGGIFFPGHAFADATGAVMDDIGLVRLRFGLRW